MGKPGLLLIRQIAYNLLITPTATMKLYLIRHAQSENNVIMDDHIENHKDTEGIKVYENLRLADAQLSKIGNRQADELGAFLARSYQSSSEDNPQDRFRFNDFDFTHIFVSPMIRTLDTIKPFIGQTDIQPAIWEDLHEQGGVWDIDQKTEERVGFPGLTPDYIRANYHNYSIPESMNPNGWWNRPYEEGEACFQRAGDILGTLIQAHGKTDHRIALITHSYLINCFLYQLFGLSATKQGYLFVVNNTSISRIDFIHQRRMLVYQNRIDFLPAELVT